MPSSSRASAAVTLLKLEPSRWLAGWWAGLHALLAGAALLGRISPSATALLLGAIALHGVGRFPRTPGLLVFSAAGLWSLPERGQHALRLGAETACCAWWARLVLVGPGTRVRVLVLRDQLDTESWRLLRLVIRECRDAVD